MDTLEVNKALKRIPHFVGTFSCDNLPSIKRYPSGMVINTQPSTHPGEHWTAIYIQSPRYAEFFDSYNRPPCHPNVERYLLNNADIVKYSSVPLQSSLPQSEACGPFAIIFLALKSEGMSYEEILSLFSKNRELNDLKATIYAHFVENGLPEEILNHVLPT